MLKLGSISKSSSFAVEGHKSQHYLPENIRGAVSERPKGTTSTLKEYRWEKLKIKLLLVLS